MEQWKETLKQETQKVQIVREEKVKKHGASIFRQSKRRLISPEFSKSLLDIFLLYFLPPATTAVIGVRTGEC